MRRMLVNNDNSVLRLGNNICFVQLCPRQPQRRKFVAVCYFRTGGIIRQVFGDRSGKRFVCFE